MVGHEGYSGPTLQIRGKKNAFICVFEIDFDGLANRGKSESLEVGQFSLHHSDKICYKPKINFEGVLR